VLCRRGTDRLNPCMSPLPGVRETATKHGSFPEGAGKHRGAGADLRRAGEVACPSTLGGAGNAEPIGITAPTH
jgi:hypothetical protein